MYYRKRTDVKKLVKLSKESNYRAGAYFDKDKGYWKKYSQPKMINHAEKDANKDIRKYKGFIANGGAYKKISVKVTACY